jgi:hypothetical protein
MDFRRNEPSLRGIIRDQAKPMSHLKNVWRKSTRKLVGRNTREEAMPVATRSPVASVN